MIFTYNNINLKWGVASKKLLIIIIFYIKKNSADGGGSHSETAALHARLWSRRVLLMEAGLTFDLLSGSKSGSRGSAAGQGTIANTRQPQSRTTERLRTTCGGVFGGTFREATQWGAGHNAGFASSVRIWIQIAQPIWCQPMWAAVVLTEKRCNAHQADFFCFFFFCKERKYSIIQRKWGQWKTDVEWVKNNRLSCRFFTFYTSSCAAAPPPGGNNGSRNNPPPPLSKPTSPSLHLLILWFWLCVWFPAQGHGGDTAV